MSGAAAPATARPAAVAFVLVTVLLDVLAFGIVVPVLPKLIETFQHGDTGRAAETYGVFATAWALMQFVFSPVLGVLSDRYGRRRVLLVSLLGLGLDYVLMALAPNLVWLFVGRVISGITAATYSTAAAYIADVTPAEKRAAAFGYIGAAWGVGFIVGPALGGVLGGIGPRLPFWIAAGLTLANTCYGYFVLPESLPRERRKPLAWRRANPLGALALVRATPGLAGLFAVHVLYTLAHYSLPAVFVLYTSYRYGWSVREVGLTLALFGACSAFVQGVLVGPAVRRIGERRAVLLGLACGVAAYAGYGLARSATWFLLALPLGGLSGLYGAALQALMTQRVQLGEQGQLQGANSSAMGLMGLIGPALFTLVFAQAIAPGAVAGGQLPGAAFLVAAVLTAFALAIAVRAARPLLAR